MTKWGGSSLPDPAPQILDEAWLGSGFPPSPAWQGLPASLPPPHGIRSIPSTSRGARYCRPT